VGGYGFLTQSVRVTRCVHFVVTRELDRDEEQLVEEAVSKGVRFVYWDYLDGGSASATIADPLGRALELAHVPYGGPLAWVQFEDDLIDLSVRYPGLVIVVDHADILLREKPYDMFELIEWFLHCFYHWYEKKKPCHLCFQMERNDSVRRLFVRGAESC
jgi:hypothetical protein